MAAMTSTAALSRAYLVSGVQCYSQVVCIQGFSSGSGLVRNRIGLVSTGFVVTKLPNLKDGQKIRTDTLPNTDGEQAYEKFSHHHVNKEFQIITTIRCHHTHRVAEIQNNDNTNH